jgi:hypothetical protein
VLNVKKERFFSVRNFLYGFVIHHTFNCDQGCGCILPEEESPILPPYKTSAWTA